MLDYIFIAGSPGSGKTTISKLLRKKLGGTPLIDFGDIRVFHLNDDWSNASEEEEQMSFENLLCILQNYKSHGYHNVIINDLTDERVQQLPNVFAGSRFKIFTLTIEDIVLRKRVLDPARDSGFRDVEAASKWNKKIRGRESVQNECKIDNSYDDPAKTADVVFSKIIE
jgi:hypothetical protein